MKPSTAISLFSGGLAAGVVTCRSSPASLKPSASPCHSAIKGNGVDRDRGNTDSISDKLCL